MNEARPQETSLWRESYAGCVDIAKAWWPWITILALLLIPGEYFVMQDQLHQIADFMDQLQAGDTDSLHLPETHHTLSAIYTMLVQFFSFYGFITLYLQKSPITIPPAFGPTVFFYWLRQIGKLILIVVGGVVAIWLVAVILYFVVGLFIPDIKELIGYDTTSAMLYGLAESAVLCVLIKWSLLTPLALSGVKPVLKPSWHVTDGKWWRLTWQWMFFDSLIMLVSTGILLVMVGVLYALGNDFQSKAFATDLGILMGIYKAILTAATSVFICTAGRVFVDEKRAVDPTFKLITSV